MAADWEAQIIAFLHDPPDKAFDIRGHEGRARRYLAAALGRDVGVSELDHYAGLGDQLAAIAERLPMPTAGARGERAVGPDANARLSLRHPISGTKAELQGGAVDEHALARTITRLVDGVAPARERYLLLWRRLAEVVAAEVSPALARVPADTRAPDHTIWHHADAAAGLASAVAGQHGGALLTVAIGPVQTFIAAARTVRDLWSGSAILSWLAFRSMRPLIEQMGPAALVYPHLRGNALLDHWLAQQTGLAGKIAEPPLGARRSPSLPSRFLALVPFGRDGETAHRLAGECRNAARAAWRSLADSVRCELDRKVGQRFPGWDRNWNEQIESFFEVTAAVLPLRQADDAALAQTLGGKRFAEAWPNSAAVRGLAEAIPAADRPGYPQNQAGRWQATVELAARLLAARRSVRHVPAYGGTATTSDRTAPKCALFGSYDQMGPAEFDAAAEFWRALEQKPIRGVGLRRNERLCAVALAKRFAAPALLAEEFGVDAEALRFGDTATIAAAEWLERAGINPAVVRRKHDNWSGQWLHWPRRDHDRDEEPCPEDVFARIRAARNTDAGQPPAYFAVLAMDADHMGAWLRGENTATLREILHEKLVGYFAALADPAAGASLDAKRPVGPALHAAISTALADFAGAIAPHVVQKHKGTLIYAGGDDLLALLPVRTALACARELRLAFTGNPAVNGGADSGYYRLGGRELLTMGERATVSAGLAVAHHRENLRAVLETARTALDAAKKAGRDTLQLAILRRSGERSTTICPWTFVATLNTWADAFAAGASDRWAYQLRRLAPALLGQDMPSAALASQIRRQLGRADEPTRRLMGNGDAEAAGNMLAGAFGLYDGERRRRAPDATAAQFFEDFVILCQAASFLARGRET